MKSVSPKFHLLFFLLATAFNVNAQNLVPNPSFESYSLCPSGLSQFYVCNEWYFPYSTPEYYNACYIDLIPPIEGPGVPINSFGVQPAFEGDGYAGIYTHFIREYIGIELTEPLIAGKCYEVEMYVSPGLSSVINQGVSNLGIHLSESPLEVVDQQIIVTPSIYHPSLILDTINWTLVSGIFVAEGGEQHLTIGNFFEDGEYEHANLGAEGGLLGYYYIENVRVEVTVDDAGEQTIETTICEGECFEYNNVQYCDPGVYSVTPQGSCYSSAELTINYEELAIADIETPSVLNCNNTLITLDASGSSSGPEITYQWSGPNNYSSAIQNPEISEPGIYTLIVDGINLCPAEVSITVSQDIIEPDILAEVIGTIDCNNLVVDLNGSSNSPNVTFQWTGPNVNTNSPLTTANQAGTYTFTVTAENGCTSTEDVNVIEDLELPHISIEPVETLDCNNSIVTLSGHSITPDVTYNRSGPGVNTNTSITSTSLPGMYTFTVFGINGCISSQEINVVEDLDLPDVFAEVLGVLDCNNSNVILSGSSTTPGVTYLWTGPGLNTESSNTTTDQPGIYNFTVYSPNGCLNSTIVNVLEEEGDLDISVFVIDTLNCLNTSVLLTGSSTVPDLNYQWSGPGLLIDSMVAEANQAGEYTFSIMTDSGCSEDTTIIVEQNIETPDINILLPDTLNCNSINVNLDASGSTGMGILNYEWIDLNGNILSTDSVLSVDTSGFYSLSLIDEENGCVSFDTIEVIQDVEAPNADAGIDGLLTCDNSEATLDGSNSTGGNLSYEWLDENDELVDSLAITQVSQPGIYTLLITDQNNGCTDSSTVSVTPDANIPTAIIELNEELNCTNSEVTLDGSSSTSVNDNSGFEWIDGLNNSISIEDQLIVSDPGVYTLIITDNENGCTHSTQVEVIQDIEAPNADAGIDGILTCDNSEATLDGSNSTGVIYL